MTHEIRSQGREKLAHGFLLDGLRAVQHGGIGLVRDPETTDSEAWGGPAKRTYVPGDQLHL